VRVLARAEGRWAKTDPLDARLLAYFLFGAGRAFASAYAFAMVEARLILAAVAQRFRLQPAD